MGALFPAALLAWRLARLASAGCPSPWGAAVGNATPCACDWGAYSTCLNCTPSPGCQCSFAAGFVNLTDYYAQECLGGVPTTATLYTAIILPLVALPLVAAVAFAVFHRRRRESLGRPKRASNASEGGGRGQPRYVSRVQQEGGEPTGGDPSHPDYENVFVDHQLPVGRGGASERRASKPHRSRDSSKVRHAGGPHGEQPIYANAQDVYCNYGGPHPTGAPDEGVYVIPDQ